jgi:Flp pilus assembly protein TadD
VAAASGPIALARQLRAKGDKAKALAELEKARAQNPKDRQLAREAGFIALELGRVEPAVAAFEAAHDPAKPDWHTLTGLGTAYASLGRQKPAQQAFSKALELRPNHAPTLNNLALSYALEGNLAKAEQTLRTIKGRDEAAPVTVQENLALVLALGGKFDDAERMAVGVLPKDKAKSNIAYLRSLTRPAELAPSAGERGRNAIRSGQ